MGEKNQKIPLANWGGCANSLLCVISYLSSFPLSLTDMFAHDGSCTRRFAAEVGQRTGTALVVSPEDVQEVTVNKKENAPPTEIERS